MTYVTFQVNPKNSKIVRQGLQDLSAETPKIGRKQLYDTSRSIVRRLQPSQAALPTWPINWDSLRQKIAFFHTDGFGGGIPHVRVGKRTKWMIIKTDTGYRVRNPSPRAVHVYGDAFGLQQSRIHVGRWPLFRNVADEELAKLPKQVQDALRIVARRKGYNAK